MSLYSSAQSMGDLLVEEAPMHVLNPNESGEHVVVYTEQPEPEVVMEMHDPEALAELAHGHMQVEEEHPGEITIQIGELPGVDGLDPELEQKLEVHEDSDADKSKAADEDLKKSKVAPKWDWQSKGSHGFIAWVKERIDDVPKHSGYDTAGVERAISYMEKLDNEISKAMRLDLDGELDADKIEEVRSQIDDGIERLHARLEKISKKSKKKKKASQDQDSLVKSAQKIPGISGIVVSVPILISGIVRLCINGTVSAGHSMSDTLDHMVKKYKLNDREVFECLTTLSDMGFPLRWDRGFLPDDDIDPTSSDNYDWSSQREN